MWRGEEKLWKVFWGGLFFPIVFFVVLGFVAGLFHFVSEIHAIFSGFSFIIANVVYTIGWAVAVWKCRNNSSSSAWKWLALFAVLIFILVSIAAVAGKLNPRPLESYNTSCVKTLQDFAQKNGIDPQKYLDNNHSYLRDCTREFYKNTCLKTMEDFAKQNNLNSEDYIKQNQSYLKQCSQSLEDKVNKR